MYNSMKKFFPFLVLCFTILSFSGCSKDDLAVVDDSHRNGAIQLNTLFDLKPINGGYILTGVYDAKITIAKLDVNFNAQWRKDNYAWGTLIAGEGWGSSFYSVSVTEVFQNEIGNFICFCSIMEGSCVAWTSGLIVILDKYGREITRKTIEDYAFVNVIQTNDKGYLLFGNRLMKLNADFSIAWEKENQNYIFSGGYSTPTEDQGFAVTGTWNSDQVFLQKFDGNGAVQWTKNNFNKNPFNDLGYDLIQMANKGFLIIGRTRDTSEPWDMNCFLIRTDSAGDTIWTKKFGDESDEWLEKFIYASEDDLIIKRTVGYPNDPDHKTMLIRINGNGEITASKETPDFEKLFFTSSGYFVKAEKTANNILSLSKIQLQDLFE